MARHVAQRFLSHILGWARPEQQLSVGSLRGVFERFTDQGRRVLVFAQEEARGLNHNFIGTEHILLGLIRENEGVAAHALAQLGITLETARAKVAQTVSPAESLVGSPPFTPRAKKVLELSLRESLQLGHNYIGTEHILLGLIRDGDGVAAEVLVGSGVELPRIRQEVLRALSGYGSRAESAPVVTEPIQPVGEAPRCPRCGTALAGEVRYRPLEATPAGHDPADAMMTVAVIYCDRCATALGTVPGSKDVPGAGTSL